MTENLEGIVTSPTIISGDAMRVLLENIILSAKADGIRDGKRFSKDAESTRIWQKLKNEEAKHRKEGRTEIADVLLGLRKWIRSDEA